MTFAIKVVQKKKKKKNLKSEIDKYLKKKTIIRPSKKQDVLCYETSIDFRSFNFGNSF